MSRLQVSSNRVTNYSTITRTDHACCRLLQSTIICFCQITRWVLVVTRCYDTGPSLSRKRVALWRFLLTFRILSITKIHVITSQKRHKNNSTYKKQKQTIASLFLLKLLKPLRSRLKNSLIRIAQEQIIKQEFHNLWMPELWVLFLILMSMVWNLLYV